jgi:beta-phosphoglucomutase-like phosphatase (HAD superfamily)
MKGNIMKYKAIIFDMDGTITNTEKIWKAATEHILSKYLPHATPEELEELKLHFK